VKEDKEEGEVEHEEEGNKMKKQTDMKNFFKTFGFFTDTGSGIANRYTDGLPDGWPCFDSRRGQEIFLYSTASRPALGSTHPPVQWAQAALS
jgi:hypothetical protein